MKYRLEAVILAYPFNASHIRAGSSKDGNLSASEGYTLDRVSDTLYIAHPGSPRRKCVPWDCVTDATIAEVQPEWSDWDEVAEMLYPPRGATKQEAPQAAGGAFPGQRIDGRTREGRALKQGQS